MLLTRPVKVSKTGNSRALPVPAEAARVLRAEVGDSYTVEVNDDQITYRRDRASTSTRLGEGGRRAVVVRPGFTLSVPGRSSVPPLDDWDF